MGLYIEDTEGQDKEEFLTAYAATVLHPRWPSPAGTELLCYVDSGEFKALGVILSGEELSRWLHPSDGRDKAFFIVPSGSVTAANCPAIDVYRSEMQCAADAAALDHHEAMMEKWDLYD